MSAGDVQTYLICLFGILVSVLLPGLWAYVRQFFPSGQKDLPKSMFEHVRPYLALGLASALTAVVLVIVLRDTLSDARAAFLAGYAWDSTLQKLK